MAVNPLTSMLNTKLRMTGMVSGLDTDTMVRQILAADRLKIERVTQKRELALWRTESYREITSSLQSFYKEFLDTISTKNLKSANSYASFSASYSATTATDYFTVTPGATAKTGTYTITEMKAATAASISGKNVSSATIKGDKDLSGLDFTEISFANDNNKFEFTFNNKTMQITLDEFPSGSTIGDFVDNLQNKINAAFGVDKKMEGGVEVETPKVKVSADADGKINFETARTTDTFSIGTVYNSGADVIFGAAPTTDAKLALTAANNKFELQIGSEKHTITVAAGTYENAAALQQAIEDAVEEKFGSNPDITFSISGEGKIKYTSSKSVSIGKTANGANEALGLKPGSLSNKVDLNSKIADMKDGFATELTLGSGSDDITFAINGKFFRFNSENTSINDIMKAVNADTTINATMKYNATTNSFTIESKSTGVTDKLTVEDKNGGKFMEVLGLADNAQGTDAKVKIAGLAGVDADGNEIEVEIVRPTNSFTYDGLTFNIKKDFSNINKGADTIFGATPTASSPLKLTADNNKFDLTIGTEKHTITVATGEYKSADDLKAAIETAVKQKFGNTPGIDFDVSGGQVTYTPSPGNSVSISATETTDPIKVTVNTDTTKTFEFVKDFVDKYNELIDKLNGKIKEKVFRDFPPLSDEQKEVMTEDQIKKWEEKAKSGLLKNDSIVSGVLANLRTALYSAVEGVGITLPSIGITTSSNYADAGKLVIDENKLKEALATKSEEIAKLFTSSSDITYYDAMNDSNLKSQRNKESGLAFKISDIIQDAIRTSTDKNGNKGTLLEKAGIVGDRSEFANLLSKEIKEFDDMVIEMNKKLVKKENDLYRKFAAMESALNKMNSQSDWMAQQFGINQS